MGQTGKSNGQLIDLVKCGGCAAKHAQDYLLPLLEHLPAIRDPNVLVGSITSDDAAVYKISKSLALVLTTDFFPQFVKDPYIFGAIAAANALSDVYAMGGKPLAALNIVGYPANEPRELLLKILRGAADKAREAGVEIVGGHTIKSAEPIFGLSVVGTVHPDKVLTNAGARRGDVLVLTKPIGVGIITTAAKNSVADDRTLKQAISVMTTLNKTAAEVLARFDVHALTDVTGFGLLGHLRNIAKASGVHAHVWAEAVPILPSALRYAEQYADKAISGGSKTNWEFMSKGTTFKRAVTEATQKLLCDAQTSGGLLASVPGEQAHKVIKALHRAGLPQASIIGKVTSGAAGKITVSAAVPAAFAHNSSYARAV